MYDTSYSQVMLKSKMSDPHPFPTQSPPWTVGLGGDFHSLKELKALICIGEHYKVNQFHDSVPSILSYCEPGGMGGRNGSLDVTALYCARL